MLTSNTTGDVPEEWYRDESHVGYSSLGLKLERQNRADSLDKLLQKLDRSDGWRQLVDKKLGAGIYLSANEVKFIRNLCMGVFVNEINVDTHIHASNTEIGQANEPKRRFLASKWESKRVINMLRSMRKKSDSSRLHEVVPKLGLLWSDTEQSINLKRAARAPRAKLGGHEDSYNAPLEYLSNPDTISDLGTLRCVPVFKRFLNEQFGRCLDLYLCPRAKRSKMDVNVSDLLQDFQTHNVKPLFPSKLMMKFTGHKKTIISMSVHPSGSLLASSACDNTVRIWSLSTGRCLHMIKTVAPVSNMTWCPQNERSLISFHLFDTLYFVDLTDALKTRFDDGIIEIHTGEKTESSCTERISCYWFELNEMVLSVTNPYHISNASWHHKGDFLCVHGSNVNEICVHQVSKRTTQQLSIEGNNSISKIIFHPRKPYILVASVKFIVVYDLKNQQSLRKFAFESTCINTLDVHPQGEYILVGCANGKLYWYNIEQSSEAERTLSFSCGVISVEFHKTQPFFSLGLSDSSVQIFSFFVADLLSRVVIDPLKTIKDSRLKEFSARPNCVLHPARPWLFRLGGTHDAEVYLFTEY